MQLPGAYAPPHGRLLLGLTETQVAGMAALQPVDALTGEIRRLYVRPAARRQGVGRGLVAALIEAARQAGYALLRLEMLEAMREAQALFRSLGFREIERFRAPVGDTDRTISLGLWL
ncbi:MAG: GNAT family N-acetyltransferase [Thermoflexales bacterium]|nr:GNAT family N-acetyltransferase [Thermoflexales bacterium]MDW8350826.1 GNAT family N-acetyltransferase [Anaerolineae bacterium]